MHHSPPSNPQISKFLKLDGAFIRDIPFFALAAFFLLGLFIVIAETRLAWRESEIWKSCCAPVLFLYVCQNL